LDGDLLPGRGPAKVDNALAALPEPGDDLERAQPLRVVRHQRLELTHPGPPYETIAGPERYQCDNWDAPSPGELLTSDHGESAFLPRSSPGFAVGHVLVNCHPLSDRLTGVEDVQRVEDGLDAVLHLTGHGTGLQ